MYSTPLEAGFLFMSQESASNSQPSLIFPGLNLEELTGLLIKRQEPTSRLLLPQAGNKRQDLLPAEKTVQQLKGYFSSLLPEPLSQKAADFFLKSQPAALVFDYQIANPNNPNVWIIKQSILNAFNLAIKSEIPPKNRKKRNNVPKLTEVNDDPLINQMAGSLELTREKLGLIKRPDSTPEQSLMNYLDQVANGNPLTPSQKEFVILTKLAGVFDPDLTDLNSFLEAQRKFPERPIKLDVCASFGVGSLGQLMPQPTLITTQSYGEKGKYKDDKQPARFLERLNNALTETALLERYGIKTQVLTAEWQMPLRFSLYQSLGKLSQTDLAIFGILPSDIKTILAEYDQAYKNTPPIYIAEKYFDDVSRKFPLEVSSGKIISSLSLLQAMVQESPVKFIERLADYFILDWLLPEIQKAGNINAFLEQIGIPFTDYRFTSLCEFHGLGFDYPINQREALKRSIRLDFTFYRPQYLVEKWLAEQVGFIGVFSNESDEKGFYQPLAGFKYNSTLPVLPIPSRKLLDEI